MGKWNIKTLIITGAALLVISAVGLTALVAQQAGQPEIIQSVTVANFNYTDENGVDDNAKCTNYWKVRGDNLDYSMIPVSVVDYGNAQNNSDPYSVRTVSRSRVQLIDSTPQSIDPMYSYRVSSARSASEIDTLKKERARNRSLGVFCAWKTRGYNIAEVVPSLNGEPYNIVIPGRSREIDMWVFGTGYQMIISVALEDYKGFTHLVELGTCEHQGWKNLSAPVASGIPQNDRYLPRERPLKVTKIIITSQPLERADHFFVAFEDLKSISDMFSQVVDGQDVLRNYQYQILGTQLRDNEVQAPQY